MANQFPAALNNYVTGASSVTLVSAGHAGAHNAYEAKIGTGSSTPVASTVLRGTGTGTSAWAALNLTTDVTGTLPLANGGTNATTAATARTSLGLVIGTDVQAFSSNLATWAGKTAPTGTVVGTTDSQTLSSKTLTAPIISTISNTGTLTLPTSTDTLVGKATTDVLTNKTLTAPKIVSGGFIADANGNEEIIFTTTASAVNEFTVINAATAGDPILSVTGGDSNVNIDLRAKGNAIIKRTMAIQKISSNFYINSVKEQSGWNYVLVASGASTGTRTVTYPFAFSTEVYSFSFSPIGVKLSTAPTAIGDGTTTLAAIAFTQAFGPDTVGLTTFGVSIKASSNAGADTYYMFSWKAYGI